MFDIGIWELALATVIALVVVKPEDLPSVLRSAGRFLGKLRTLSREFSQHMNDMIEEAEINEIIAEKDNLKQDIKEISTSDFSAFSDMMPDIIDDDEADS